MTAPTPPDYKAWLYRATVRITNKVAVAGFQHLLTLTWKPGMRSDFRDIRFTQENGINCPYWIETYTARTSATVWIKVPSASQSLIYLYFGNGQASSASSGTNTFDFFDDFITLDTTNTWDTYVNGGNTPSATGSILSFSCTGSGNRYSSIRSKNIVASTSLIVRARLKATALAADYDGVRLYHNAKYTHTLTNTPSASNYCQCMLEEGIAWGTPFDAGNVSLDTYYNLEVYFSGTNLYGRKNDAAWTSWGRTTAPANYKILIGSWNASGSTAAGTCDWVLARKYTATEPMLAVSNHGVNPNKRGWPGLSLTSYGGTEYAFDPVNVDHTHTPGVDAFLYEQSFPSTNVNHSRTPAVGVTEIEMGPVNVYHARYPVASWDRVITNPVDDTGTLISVTVSRGMDDAMTQADFEYDGTAIGDIFGTDYMTKIQVKIPDYNGVSRTVFVGIAPSSRAHYEPAKDKMILTAVDYGLYLTKNPLEDKDLALLPPANQIAGGSNYAKVLFFNYGIIPFQLGQRVVGAISGATGTIIEVYAGGSMRMTLYPAQGTFVDDEALMVGGVQYATADGRSMDTSYTPLYLPIYPEDWVRSVLGGDNWMRVTGIEPYKIVSSGGYWDTATCPAVPFMFGSKESIFDAMMRLAKYMKYIMLIKPRDIGGGNYRPALYWVPLSEIDESMNGLDLPEAAAITGPNDPFLASPFELEQNGDNQVDRIKLMCQDLFGNWLTSVKGTSYANAGEGPVRTFYDEPQDIATQTDLDALCSDLYDLFTPRGMVWHCTFVERSDLELYQLLTISGYGDKIPNGTYRIIKIAYERGCPQNLTHVTFMLSSAFSTLLKYGMTYTDSISEIQRIMKHWDTLKPQTELGTCIATDGTTVTYETEAASKGRGRDGTAVGSTPGSIIIDAKIIIHSTRGGIICLPVVGEAATGTGLTTVDEPTIISALEDPDDHNYWFLKWEAGANNTGVSVNIQTGSYPPAPGSVTGPGITFARYTRTIYKIRIRFSGPSTTYYIKIWGESNGVYSSTGDTATIVSGSDVTVGPGEDPEGFTVLDEFLVAGQVGYQCGDLTIFNGDLSFSYNGTDNIYIGGPQVWDSNSVPGNCQEGNLWGNQPGLRWLICDSRIEITGPGGMIAVHPPWPFWSPPINIKTILNSGINHLTIVIKEVVGYGWSGCTDLYIRSGF